MMRSRRRSSGFILLTAILMIAIVAVALVTMTTAASSQSRRQSSDVQQAQREQLLLAGARDALQRFNSASPPKPNESFKVDLPAALSGNADLEVHVDSASSDAASATVRATVVGRAESQTIQFAKHGAAWQLKSASLQ
jgi:type II secretory pathway pseudopilin PulG